MRIYKAILTGMAAAMMAAQPVAAENYRVEITVPTEADAEGAMAVLKDYDSGAKLDSALVTEGRVLFSGDVAGSRIARVAIDDTPVAQFILEPGDIAVDIATRDVKGGALNATMDKAIAQVSEVMKKFKGASYEQAAALEREYEACCDSIVAANADNAVGLMFFIELVSDYDVDAMEAALTRYPQYRESKRVQKMQRALANKAATQPGSRYVDFEVTYEGVTKRLSDYVGKGEYVLVDFWASWCGPCIREIAVLKDLYKEYGPQGLKVLGVAVWDEPANTKKAIETHQIPWECIINAQTIPTDLYGISGIPCIILFAPDGTIVSRDKQDDALRADVAAAMTAAAK